MARAIASIMADGAFIGVIADRLGNPQPVGFEERLPAFLLRQSVFDIGPPRQHRGVILPGLEADKPPRGIEAFKAFDADETGLGFKVGLELPGQFEIPVLTAFIQFEFENHDDQVVQSSVAPPASAQSLNPPILVTEVKPISLSVLPQSAACPPAPQTRNSSASLVRLS